MEAYGLLEMWNWKPRGVEGRSGDGGIRAFQLTLPASSPRVASERAGKRTKLAGIHLLLMLRRGLFVSQPNRYIPRVFPGQERAQNRGSRPNWKPR